MLNYEFPPLGGGTGNANHFLLREFTNRPGLTIDLLTSSPSHGIEEHRWGTRVRIVRLPVKKRAEHFWTAGELWRWLIQARSYARQLLERDGYDLCHCWSGWPAGVLGYLFRQRMPYLVALRGSDVPGYNPRLRLLDPLFFRPLSRRIWRNAAAVTCVSDNQAKLAAKTAPWLLPVRIGNGVDTGTFQPGTADNPFTILFVGRLIERKGVQYLVRAVAALRGAGHDCRLVIAGSGPEQEKIDALTRELGVADHVELQGYVDRARLPALYAGASVFALPAFEEAMSNALLEAMAAGLPLVTTRNGIVDLMDDNGIIVPAGDQHALENAVRRYLEDPVLRREHGCRSRQIALELGWARVADAYLDLYAKILGRGMSDQDAQSPPAGS